MSDALRGLRNQARDLEKLLKDVKQSERQTSLDSTVDARNSLGDEVVVSRWALLEHFLVTFVEWNQIHERYVRYFGQTEHTASPRWHHLRHECAQTCYNISAGANQAYQELPSRFAQQWLPQAPGHIRHSDGSPDVEALYHEIVQADLQWRTAMACRWQPESPLEDLWQFVSEARYPQTPAASAWQNLANDLRGTQQRLLARFSELEPAAQSDLRYFLRNYRHATLRVSWLEQQGRDNDNSLLFAINNGESGRVSVLRDFLEIELMRDDRPDKEYRIVDRVLGRIADAIREIGYESFVDDVTSEDFLGGEDSPLGSAEINIIPGKGHTACCPVLVAVSRGASRRSKLGFGKIMQEVKVHLTSCAGVTKAVIVLCDTWDSRSFIDEHYVELQAHHRKGVRFLFLMIGAPNTAVSGVRVRF